MSSERKARQDLTEALNVAMREMSGQGVLFSQAVAQRLGIASSDLECLDLVVLRGSATAGELAEASGLTTGAITGVIDRLEKAGYARREADARDRRKVVVRATPGVGRIEPLFVPMAHALSDVLDRYSDAQLAFLLDFATRARSAAIDATARMREVPLTAPKARKRSQERRGNQKRPKSLT
jgi:DNA-binding MarR family transcriptional regulator